VIRVLVVDDDFMVAKVNTGYVQRTPGFDVVGVAHSAAEALAKVVELTPDLVLLDVYLPDRSGLDVLADLRTAAAECDVLMVTAARDEATIKAAMRGGAVSYVVKPFDQDVLSAKLGEFARRRERLARGLRRQGDVDELFGAAGRTEPLPPKGLAPETVTLVSSVLRSHEGDLSAAECGELAGLSRVSARRYLEHLVTSGRASVRLRYGNAGRPERRYRWVDDA
jgi:response regulator of citrate/malate metabolism